MKHLFSRITQKPILYISLLVLLELVIFFTNYLPGTYLIGWDQVSPEFDLSLNLKRAVSSLWQNYRGLGVLDGMAHAANLFHTLYIWLLSLVLPQALLRYVFIHLTHLMGGIGMFLLLKHLLTSYSSNDEHSDESKNTISAIKQLNKTNPHTALFTALLGAMFYMLNLGVIQLYYAPLEVFAVHFAALPFLALQMTKSLRKPDKKNLLLLFTLCVLFSPQAFVPTVFVAFSLFAGTMLLHFAFTTRRIKETLIVAVTIFLANAFWLLPYGYSALHTPDTIRSSKINQIASEEIFYRNKAYGDLISVLSLKGFMLSTIEYDVTAQQDVYFMQRWIDHSDNLLYRFLFLLIIAVTTIGLYRTISRRDHHALAYLGALMISFLFLANDTPGLEQFNAWFRSFFPILGEAFRFPFTKFMTLFAFSLSIFFTLGTAFLLHVFSEYRKQILVLAMIILFFLSFPIFQGHFTSPLIRLSLPSEYLTLFSSFQEKNPEGRIALLPVHTFWNWQYRSWNYRGSDFLWYGLPQPILERAFDPWSQSNEQYFTEISSAVSRQDADAFRRVLEKYDINSVVVDTTLLNTLAGQPINFPSLEIFLTDSVGLEKDDSYGKLQIYKAAERSSHVYSYAGGVAIGSMPLRGGTIGLENNVSTYYTSDAPTIIPLFPSLSSEKLQENLTFSLDEKQYSFIIQPKSISPIHGPLSFTSPSLFSTEYLVPVEVRKVPEGLTFIPLYPFIRINGITLPIEGEAITLRLHGVRNPTEITMVDTGHIIPFTEGIAKTYLLNPYSNTIRVSDGTNTEILALNTEDISREDIIIPLDSQPIYSIEAEFPKISSPFEYADLIQTHEYSAHEAPPTLPSHRGNRSAVITENGDSVTMEAKNTTAELTFFLENLYHQGSYLLTAEIDYDSGLPIHFYIDNPTQKRSELETVLSKEISENIIVLPKTENFFQGYGFHFSVKSVGTERAKATVKEINLYPFPLETLSQMTIAEPSVQRTGPARKKPLNFSRTTFSAYTGYAPKDNSLLVLSQTYDPGWKAYSIKRNAPKIMTSAFPFIFGEEITTHTKVNNWANGWILEGNDQGQTINDNTQIIIVYLPQYLQYLGQAITLGTLMVLLALTIRRIRRA